MLEKIIDVLLKLSGVEEKVRRNERVLRILKQFNLDSEHPPSGFSDVYAYALVEYAFDERGDRKPEPLIKLFRTEAVKQLFRQAFEHNAPQAWLSQGESLIARSDIGREMRRLNIDLPRELAAFARIFLEITRQSRTPKETLAAHRLDSLQRQMEQLQTQIKQLPLTELHQAVNQLIGQTQPPLFPPAGTEQTCRAAPLAQQLAAWFEVLGYDRERHNLWAEDYFEWMINIPVRRRRYDRIVVRGIAGEAAMADVQALRQSVETLNADEGWLVSHRRVSQAARRAIQQADHEALSCYTLDELLDEDADFTGYLDWLEQEIKQRGIDSQYVPLACTKAELDPVSQQQIGLSRYAETDGWIDGYIDLWLDDPAKEHISILGEFGTGKTWFALHYAWTSLQRYKTAKQRGLERPRLPLVISLRDYAKVVSVESLFSEFFFRKHEIPLPGYSAFEQLNRMGKLLVIFDGFDEMAARVDRQQMIDNFWELAKVVTPASKAILTCRTEYFPDAIEGRQLLNAELQASTANLSGESPQFEVLELEQFSPGQIRQVLAQKAKEPTVETILANPQLLDLARRPVMVDLILEALPEIEAGKPIDLSRVYLYAVTHKMARDIKDERTFTSLADKLYFLCELSWEMLSTDQMSLNYRAFPAQLQRLFPNLIEAERDLDHWRYDMMGQTMLIRNSEGDYSPSHRSLLEFFAAYKIVAFLGALADDFTDIARQQTNVDNAAQPQAYTWADYFQRQCDDTGKIQAIAPLQEFVTEPFEQILELLSQARLAKAVLDLAVPMLDPETMRDRLLPLIYTTRGRQPQDIAYLGGNIAQLMLDADPWILEQTNLSQTILQGVDFANSSLRWANFANTALAESIIPKVFETATSVTFSPDGHLLALGESNGTVQVWDLSSWRIARFYQGHQDGVRSVAFSPDGATLASGSDDHTIKFWSVSEGNCFHTLAGHQNRVWSVAFSPDGATLASGSDDHTIKFWSVSKGTCLHTLAGHQDRVWSVAFSSDGTTLASGSFDHTIKFWSVSKGTCLHTLAGHQDRVWSVAFSPDGTTLASGSFDHTIKLWSVRERECLHTLTGHQDGVLSVAFNPDDSTLASSSADYTVKLWSLSEGTCLHTLTGYQDWVLSVIFSPDGSTLASGGDQTVKLWSVGEGTCLHTFAGHQNRVWSVAFSPVRSASPDGFGSTMASGSDHTIKLWSVSGGECLHTLARHQDGVWSVAFSPDGSTLASGSDDHTIKLWSVSGGECLHTLAGHQDRVSSVAFSPDGAILATGSADRTIKLWSVGERECLHTLAGHQKWVWSVAFSPDGSTLASGSLDHTIKLWSVSEGTCLHTFAGHQNKVRSVVFSPNGATLASGSADHTIKLWSVSEGTCLHTLAGHQDRVRSVAFSPDGSTLASGSFDHTIKVWSMDEGECIHTLAERQNAVLSVVFSPDGSTLASGSLNQAIRLWDVQTGECLRVISDKLCEGLDITGAVGLTEAQRVTLKLLGARERE